MIYDLQVLKRVTSNLSKFPTIGNKTALRMILQIINYDTVEFNELMESISQLKNCIKFCIVCNSFTDNPDKICNICQSDSRDNNVLCIVEQPMDVFVIEQADVFKGKYFVLKGVIDVLNGIGPEDIELAKLFKYIKSNKNLNEIIIATNPTLKGETTANYIEDELKDYDIKISRIAYGMPVGASIDYADVITLQKSFSGRNFIKQ
jgi:recombination protein RecR